MRIISKNTLLCAITLLVTLIALYVIAMQPLSEAKALTILFGDYNHSQKQAIWHHIPFDTHNTSDGFWEKKTGIVSTVLFQPFTEQNKHKIFLLTQTRSTDVPYDCHACAPLLSAFVFAKKHIWSSWQLEAQNRFLTYADEYGTPPVAKLIRIGADKYGLLLNHTYHGNGVEHAISIVAPYHDQINVAYHENTSQNNFDDCGDFLPCTALTASRQWASTNTSPFYTLQIKRLGTINDSKQNNKIQPVDENLYYQLQKGIYVLVKCYATTDHFYRKTTAS